jgi:hypothetical protein
MMKSLVKFELLIINLTFNGENFINLLNLLLIGKLHNRNILDLWFTYTQKKSF